MKRSDVRLGSATLPVHDDGGWALPGGGRTTDPLEAMAIAAELAARMPQGEIPEVAGLHRQPAAPKRLRQPVRVTRRPADCTRLVHSRV